MKISLRTHEGGFLFLQKEKSNTDRKGKEVLEILETGSVSQRLWVPN